MLGQRRLLATIMLVVVLLGCALLIARPGSAQASAMIFGRSGHSATTLNDGKILVTGGSNATAAELYDPATDSWALTGAMQFRRSRHVAIKLADGRVLVLGGSRRTANGEIYDPTTGRWSLTAEASVRRDQLGAALLTNGEILVVGGADGSAANERYNPATNTWAPAAANLTGPRSSSPGVIALPDGRALVVGDSFLPPFDAELYDPVADRWSLVRQNRQIIAPTLTRLADGRIVIMAAQYEPISLLFDPATNLITPAAPLPVGLFGSTATPLADGRILVMGVGVNTGRQHALLYDPAQNRWIVALAPGTPRDSATVTLIGGGQVLIAGGSNDPFYYNQLSSAELYNPTQVLLDERTFLPILSVAYPPPAPTRTPNPLFPTPTPSVPLPTTTPAAATVLIDDVLLQDPAFPDDAEFSQLRHSAGSAVNIGGWRLTNASRPDGTRAAVPAFVFPAFTLEENISILVYSGVGDDDLAIGDFYWDQAGAIFKAGDRVELRTSQGLLVHSFVIPSQ